MGHPLQRWILRVNRFLRIFSGKGPTQIRIKRRTTGVADEDAAADGESGDNPRPGAGTKRKVNLPMYPPGNMLRELVLAQMQVKDDSDEELKEYYEMIK